MSYSEHNYSGATIAVIVSAYNRKFGTNIHTWNLDLEELIPRLIEALDTGTPISHPPEEHDANTYT